MLFLRFLLLAGCFAFLAGAAGAVLYDTYLIYDLARLFRRRGRAAEAAQPVEAPGSTAPPRRARRAIRWNTAAQLTTIGALAGLAGLSIVVVPDGHAGVRVSQISGVLPGTLYAGTHFIFPLVDRIALYDIRDRVFSTAAEEVRNEKLDVLTVEAREGLSVGPAGQVAFTRPDPGGSAPVARYLFT